MFSRYVFRKHRITRKSVTPFLLVRISFFVNWRRISAGCGISKSFISSTFGFSLSNQSWIIWTGVLEKYSSKFDFTHFGRVLALIPRYVKFNSSGGFGLLGSTKGIVGPFDLGENGGVLVVLVDLRDIFP
jgi:hypothetical protein